MPTANKRILIRSIVQCMEDDLQFCFDDVMSEFGDWGTVRDLIACYRTAVWIYNQL